MLDSELNNVVHLALWIVYQGNYVSLQGCSLPTQLSKNSLTKSQINNFHFRNNVMHLPIVVTLAILNVSKFNFVSHLNHIIGNNHFYPQSRTNHRHDWSFNCLSLSQKLHTNHHDCDVTNTNTHSHTHQSYLASPFKLFAFFNFLSFQMVVWFTHHS